MFPETVVPLADGPTVKKRLTNTLANCLSKDELTCIYNSYDIVGDIAIVRLTEVSEQYGRLIAEAIMKSHRNVKTVLAQIGPVHGDFRIRRFEHLAGERKTATIHAETGCSFLVDVEKCYFSPRLSHERMRIAGQVKPGEIIVNMFAGIGCFSLVIARHSRPSKIYSIDINPAAFHFMQQNIRRNGAFGRVVPMLGDAEEIVSRRLCSMADRVLMPLPDKALAYLPCAILALSKGEGWIHYYDFAHAAKNEDPIEKVEAKVVAQLQNLGLSFEIVYGRIVRSTGPNWHQIVLDIQISSQKPNPLHHL